MRRRVAPVAPGPSKPPQKVTALERAWWLADPRGFAARFPERVDVVRDRCAAAGWRPLSHWGRR